MNDEELLNVCTPRQVTPKKRTRSKSNSDLEDEGYIEVIIMSSAEKKEQKQAFDMIMEPEDDTKEDHVKKGIGNLFKKARKEVKQKKKTLDR